MKKGKNEWHSFIVFIRWFAHVLSCKRPVCPIWSSSSFISWGLQGSGASPLSQTIKNLPAMQETQVQSLGREDPLEEGMAPAFLPGESHGQRILGEGLQSIGLQRVGHN